MEPRHLINDLQIEQPVRHRQLVKVGLTEHPNPELRQLPRAHVLLHPHKGLHLIDPLLDNVANLGIQLLVRVVPNGGDDVSVKVLQNNLQLSLILTLPLLQAATNLPNVLTRGPVDTLALNRVLCVVNGPDVQVLVHPLA